MDVKTPDVIHTPEEAQRATLEVQAHLDAFRSKLLQQNLSEVSRLFPV